MAAFPSGYNLDRSSAFTFDEGVETDVFAGAATQRVIGGSYVTIDCKYQHLTSAERSTLRTFLTGAARYETVTMTIDGINYSGVLLGGFTETMTGNRYTISFNYRAEVV